ncbi:hypothetical protein FSP39_012823 [Pinctada imbricata]|nr:hypothetical protein FSP39_012823 [Pinctada imbricata]
MESGSSVGEILQKFGETAVNTNERTELIIFRKKILESAFLGMARPAFKLNAKIYIKFSGEIGQDYGGPRREFFRLAMKELAMSTMFEGKSGSRIFSHNIKLLEENKYCIAGRLVALSFAQEGPGPHFFNGTLYDLMTETKQEQGASIEKIQDVLPFNVQEILKQLLDMQSETDREKFLVDHGEWLTEQGIPNIWRLAIVKKMEMADLIIKQFVYYRTAAEISQFVNGMESVSNFWSLVKSNPAIFKALFCYTVEPLSKQQFESLCNVSYSEIGSNKRCLEDETIYCWEVFLQDISDGNIPVTFEELLAFITGADKVPPCGFSKAIDISFYPVEHGVYRLPHVSTCSLELHLPRGIDDIKAFQELMIRALKESMGFEKI